MEVRGYAFQIHLKYLLWKMGARMYEAPINFTDRVLGKSKLSSHIIEEGIILPWKIRFKK
jgi:dolichol-phosphate mannosyltransferase